MALNDNEYDFTVTRQSRWPDGTYIVEITQGGLDYTNPDALCEEYEGEFKTFQGLVAATDAAILIARAWREDEKKKEKPKPIHIAVGCTSGWTVHFEEQRISEKVFRQLKKEAKAFDEKLPKCAQCGKMLGDNPYGDYDLNQYDCCSERCAGIRYAPGCIQCGDTIETSYGDNDDCCSQACADKEYEVIEV